MSGDWAIADGGVIALDTGAAVELPDGLVARCVLALDGGRALVGTSDARLVEVGGPEGTARDAVFDAVPTRGSWTTPWGGPPDTRTLAAGAGGPYVGVHVGGVWRPGTGEWVEVVPAEADDHEVAFGDGVLAVAAGIGVGQSGDRGATWHWSDDGLHGRYCRSVADRRRLAAGRRLHRARDPRGRRLPPPAGRPAGAVRPLRRRRAAPRLPPQHRHG